MMRLVLLNLLSLWTVGYGRRYIAPEPDKVKFTFRKIPTLTELINDAGYQHDRFETVTDDGHILALHRISSFRAVSRDRGVPVLIINGFGFQSEGWLALGKSSLPIILTDLGYDVWLGDQRGTVRSVKHMKYSLGDARNHNYTFHEQGIYDLPAFIDHILRETGRQRLLYVGYSLSSGMMIAMNSERPEYNDKLLGAVLLAPAGHLRKWGNNRADYLAGLRVMDSMIESQIRTSQWLLFGNINLVKESFAGCSIFPLNALCQIFVFNMYGVSDAMDPQTMFYQFAMTAAPTSVYVGKHLLQVIKHGRFCKFDYGTERNLVEYGSAEPPNYTFNSTRVPVYMFYSGLDKMVTPDAAKRSARELGSLMSEKFIKRFNHADYLFAKTAPRDVYEDVVEFFDSLTSETLQ